MKTRPAAAVEEGPRLWMVGGLLAVPSAAMTAVAMARRRKGATPPH